MRGSKRSPLGLWTTLVIGISRHVSRTQDTILSLFSLCVMARGTTMALVCARAAVNLRQSIGVTGNGI